MKKKFVLQALLPFIISFTAAAQDKLGIKFNHVTPEDFSISKLKVDSTLGAIIIADIGNSSFEGNNKGWFTLVYKHKRRVKIIDKKGFDLASVEIPLYFSDNNRDEEKLESLKATTYNLENGVVVETKLDKDAVFKDKKDKNHIIKKFTMPAIKEGSIIEYSYTINSDYLFNLQPWSFQGDFPRVWSEYELDLPNFFEYVTLTQGYSAYDINTRKTRSENYFVRIPSEDVGERSESVSIPSINGVSRWVIKNVPALKEERFTTSLNNHLTKIEFQMSAQQFPNSMRRNIMGDWQKLTETLLQNKDFGERLDKNNAWLSDEMKFIVGNSNDKLEKAKNIFSYVKNNIKCIGNQNIYLSKPIKDIFKDKSGYVADVNLLLVALMNKENIAASPVILSTRSHGLTEEFYPLINRFNYVICKIQIDDDSYFLDASKPYFGFNRLPQQCFNGHARIVDKAATPVYFNADAIVEKKETIVTLYNDEKNTGKWAGFFDTKFGYFESCDIRKKFTTNEKENFEKKIKESYSTDFLIEDIKYENEKTCENPLAMSYAMSIDVIGNGIIYFNPMIKEGYKENLFASADRKYPIEMPCLMDENYLLTMEIPAGYVVDELPKSVRVKLNEADGMFEYIITKSDQYINLSTRIKLEKANFVSDDYESVRSFFDYIVKKHAEQIVFKKK